MKQRTITRPVSLHGIGVNSGEAVTLTLLPAHAGQGIVFRRIDLPGRPEIKAGVLAVTDLVRKTALASGGAEVRLVEHVLSALHGSGIDNVTVEMNAPEAPIMDGSARAFVDLLLDAEPLEQNAERDYFTLEEPVSVTRGAASILALPSNELRVTYTALDERAVYHAQHLSIAISPETYAREIAPARTYVLHEDAEAMRQAGGIRGGTLDNCIVLKGKEILCNEPLRFPDELVRHKILDIIGDVMLLGRPLKAHLIATRAGHALHAELTKVLCGKLRARDHVPADCGMETTARPVAGR